MAVETAVPLDHCEIVFGPGDKRVRLRAGVLRLGGMLGWESREVISFAEAVTGCPWRRCGCAEFEMVLEEYRAIASALNAKTERASNRNSLRTNGTSGNGHAHRD